MGVPFSHKALRVALALALACALVPASAVQRPAWAASATSGVSGGVAWSFEEDTGELTIAPAAEDECKSGYDPGEMYDCSAASSAPWYPWRGDVVSLVVEEGVSNIGDYSFGSSSAASAYPSLACVELPSTLESVGWCAFARCGVTSLELPDAVESLDWYAFYYCPQLQELELSASLSSVGVYAFAKCTALVSVELPEGLTCAETDMFFGCTSLASVSLPSTLEEVAYAAFGSCSSLASVTIPAAVESIGGDAFAKCTALSEVTFEGVEDGSSALESIGAGAFWGCSSLASVRISLSTSYYADQEDESDNSFPSETELDFVMPDAAEGVAVCSGQSGSLEWAYYASLEVDGTTLERVLVFSGEGAMGSYSASTAPVWANWEGDAAVLEVVVGEGATSVGAYAFRGMTGVGGYELAEGVTSIGTYAFAGSEGATCGNVASLSFLPSTVTQIGSYAFSYTGLTSLEGLPDAVESIGSGAFEGCADLASASFGQESALSGIGDGVFAGAGEGLVVDLGACSALTKASQLGDAVFSGTDVGELVLPDALRSLDVGLLDGAASVGELVLPATLATVEGSFAGLGCVVAYTVRYGKLTTEGDGAEELLAALEVGIGADMAVSQAFCYGGLAETGDLDECAACATVTMDFEGGADEAPRVVFLASADGAVEDVEEGELSYDEGEGVWRLVVVAEATGCYAALSEKPSVAEADVTVGDAEQVYDGTAHEPSVSVVYGGAELAQGEDYTLSYTDNVNVGTACVTVTGAGAYTGTATATFTIEPASVEAPAAAEGLVYTGEELTGVAADADGRYTVSGGTATDAGTYTATVSLADAANYMWEDGGTADVQVAFAIARAKLAAANVTLAYAKTAYTGKKLTPAVTVKAGGAKLSKGTDYTVSYSNNKAIGKAAVKVTGTGNYTGTVTKTFKVVPGKASLKKATKSKAKKRLTVKWAKVAGGVTKYQVRWRVKGTKKWKVKTVSGKKASVTLKKLKSGKRYQVQVRACKTVSGTKYYGAWSKAKTVKVR